MEDIGLDSKLLFTESDMQALGIGGRSTLRKYRESGELVPIKLGKSIRYRREDVMSFIQRMAEVQHGRHSFN